MSQSHVQDVSLPSSVRTELDAIEDWPAPNLFLIGAMKSGSTTLASHLVRSPDIAFYTKVKEAHIFNQGSLEATAQHLKKKWVGDPNTRYILDATPNYSRDPNDNCPELIHQISGSDVRFIYLLRNPVERAISHYFWDRELYGQSLSFEAAIGRDPRYVEAGLYDLQILRYLKSFANTQFKFVKFEDFTSQVDMTVAEILDWLEAAPTGTLNQQEKLAATDKVVTRTAYLPGLVSAIRANRRLVEAIKRAIPGRYHTNLMRLISHETPREEISTATKSQVLETYFRESIMRTESLTGLDLTNWLQFDDVVS